MSPSQSELLHEKLVQAQSSGRKSQARIGIENNTSATHAPGEPAQQEKENPSPKPELSGKIYHPQTAFNPTEDATSDIKPAAENDASFNTFTLFLKLPAEIQLNVWKFAAKPEPRDIQVTLSKETINAVDKGYLKAITPPPAILHTCHDARVAGLKTYKTKAFIVERKGREEEEIIYAIPELDTIIVHLPKWTPGLSAPFRGTSATASHTTSRWQDSAHAMWYI
ncbi:uncharacterized protein PAC_05416 [Phialocephala subalpina]|uniref:2EXR domain-containing protein n=1 Tax=Phialocephala subalpina TaxID=576137 RepID=A0A1L7WRX2_9HELO|nr:uncharacterized protein PAC_05416 [Phialocephala subalpina]